MDHAKRKRAHLRRFVLASAVVGSALCAPPMINLVFGADPPLRNSWTVVALLLSTAAWTALWFVWGRRCSLWHFLWIGPIFGALNAGTSVALIQALDSGSVSMGQIVPPLILGTLAGLVVGSPFGLLFAGGLTWYRKAAERAIDRARTQVTPDVLFATSIWLATTALLAFWCGRTSPSRVDLLHMGTPALGLAATSVALACTIVHLRVYRWMSHVQNGTHLRLRLRTWPHHPSIIVHRTRESGPFRSRGERVLGPMIQEHVLLGRAALSGVLTVIQASLSIIELI